jgi:hypothetical protein
MTFDPIDDYRKMLGEFSQIRSESLLASELRVWKFQVKTHQEMKMADSISDAVAARMQVMNDVLQGARAHLQTEMEMAMLKKERPRMLAEIEGNAIQPAPTRALPPGRRQDEEMDIPLSAYDGDNDIEGEASMIADAYLSSGSRISMKELQVRVTAKLRRKQFSISAIGQVMARVQQIINEAAY